MVTSVGGGEGSVLEDVRVVADDENNALMIYATGKQYKIITAALEQLEAGVERLVVVPGSRGADTSVVGASLGRLATEVLPEEIPILPVRPRPFFPGLPVPRRLHRSAILTDGPCCNPRQAHASR